MNMVVTTTHGYLNKVQQQSLNYATCVLIGPRLARPANDIGDLPYNAYNTCSKASCQSS